MKKILSSAAIILMIVACNSAGNNTTTTDTNASEGSMPDKGVGSGTTGIGTMDSNVRDDTSAPLKK